MVNDIVVFLVAFACSGDLLHCAPHSTPIVEFADVTACRDAASAIASPLDAIGTGAVVVMARCRFDVREPGQAPRLPTLAVAKVW